MFAIIKVGGNQYRVEPGIKIDVDKLTGNVGEQLTIPALLVANGTDVKVGAEAGKTLVSVKIAAHMKGDKVDVYRFKAKSRYRKHIGFRAQLTQLEVVSIGDHKLQPVEKKQAKSVISQVITPKKKVAPKKKTEKKSL